MPLFIQHRIYPLIVQNCQMVLEAEAGGAYRAVAKHFWMVLKHDTEAIRWYWRERLAYLALRLRGWDRAAIAMKVESEYHAEFPDEEEETL